MLKTFDDSFKVSRPLAIISRRYWATGMPYAEGEVRTPHGIANFYWQDDCAHIVFVWNGREHRRNFNGVVKLSGMTRRTTAFVREIVAK